MMMNNTSELCRRLMRCKVQWLLCLSLAFASGSAFAAPFVSCAFH